MLSDDAFVSPPRALIWLRMCLQVLVSEGLDARLLNVLDAQLELLCDLLQALAQDLLSYRLGPTLDRLRRPWASW